MTAVPIQSLNPAGITLTHKHNNNLFIARGSLLERFKIIDDGQYFLFKSSHKYDHKIMFISVFDSKLLIGFSKVLTVVDQDTYETLEIYDSVPLSEKTSIAKNTRYSLCDQSQMVLTLSDQNYLTFIHLGLKKSHSLPFRQGTALSIASYKEYFAVLAQVSPLHSGTVLNNFRNIRSTYLAVYSTQNKKVVEVQRVTQLPYDAYKVFSGPDGFVIASPKQLIFKSFRQQDTRVRFARHPEENPQNVEDRLGEFLGAYLSVDMGFDFSNLTQCKHYTAMEDNTVRENELLPTSDQHGLPLAPAQLVPGSPCPANASKFRYYGYDPREINLKLNQLINVVGDFPVFDYTLEVELGNLSNQKYLGMKSCFQNWFEITPIYTADLIFFDSQHALLANCMQGLMYLVKLDPHNAANTKITPVTIADKNLPLQNENVICGLQLLGVENSLEQKLVPDSFNENKKVPAWNVLVYTSIGDSYVMEFQLTTSIPPQNYYNDYRHDVTRDSDELFRKQLYDQLRGSCKMLNVSEDTGYEREYELFKQNWKQGEENAQTVDFAGVPFKLNQFIMDQLYAANNTSENVNVFTANKGLHGEEYNQQPHLNAFPIAIIPSFAGVIDSTAKLKRSSKSMSASVSLLHHSGCIQTIKQNIWLSDTQLLVDKIEDPIISIFKLFENESEMFVLVTHNKNAAQIYKITLQGKEASKVTKQHELSKLVIKDNVITAKQVNKGFVIVTTKDIIYQKQMGGNPSVHNVVNYVYEKRTGCAQSASIVITNQGNVVVEMCFENNIYYHDLDANKRQVLDIYQSLDIYAQYEVIINASNSFCPEDVGLSTIFNYNDQNDNKQSYLIISTLYSDDGIVWIVGLRSDYYIDVLAIFSLYNKQFNEQKENGNITFTKTVPVVFTQDIRSEITNYIDYDDLNEKENKHLLPFQVSQIHFERVQVPGTDQFNIYMFAALYGGGIYVYQLENFRGTYIQFKRLLNLSGQLNETKRKENRWATLTVIEKTDYRVVQTKFVEKVTENGVECLVFGYPQPAGHVEPASYVAVPTLFGSLSFYQLGRAPSAIKTLEGSMNIHFNGDQVPIRSLIQHKETGKYVILADFAELKPKEFQTVLNGVLFIGQKLLFGEISSAIPKIPLHKAFSRFDQLSTLRYFASLAGNGYNTHRSMLMLPFCTQRFSYHAKSDCFIVVASTSRYEIRPYHSITIDEVANIRIFNVVEDEYESGKSDYFKTEDECIKFCHKLIPRDPAPFNTHSIINHEHVFLVGHGQILDHLPIEFNKTEHINALTSGLIESKYPSTYTKSWVSAYSQQDKFGRNDRRCKNSEELRRAEALQGKTIKQERRELVFIGTGYLMGNFNKQYGKIYVCTVESVQQSGPQINQSPENTDGIKQYSNPLVPRGEKLFQLNLISQEEFQNAVTAVIVQTQSSCVLIAQAKLINGYYFSDGQKLVKCHSTPGFVYISHFAKFQDFMMITDHNFDTKLWVWRDRGKRLTQIGGRSKDSSVVTSDFLVNEYEREMFCCYQFLSKMGIYHYKYNSDKKYFEKLMLKQIINTPETVVQLVKVVTSIPEPSDQSIGSSVALLLVDAEGGIIQLVPAPESVFQRLGISKTFIDIDGELKYLYADQVAGNIINEQKGTLNDLEYERIQNRIASTKAIF